MGLNAWLSEQMLLCFSLLVPHFFYFLYSFIEKGVFLTFLEVAVQIVLPIVYLLLHQVSVITTDFCSPFYILLSRFQYFPPHAHIWTYLFGYMSSEFNISH